MTSIQENTEQKKNTELFFKLDDNYGMTIRRLKSLQVALQRNPEQCRWYRGILNRYEREDMIETFSSQSDESAGVYYTPHAGVWKPRKRVPLRINFDASSKKRGKLPLIDDIEKSTSFINKIHDMLLTSQTSKVVLKCDAEAVSKNITKTPQRSS
ncbi:unnamed protein product [Haemonchus placei]|uniref:Transposase n=1 Tax=Haemonchus placei TaxID=6290 RepID=A0A0N4WK41_HAEPC|nr:unnamed protein product [Haemonchus placei]